MSLPWSRKKRVQKRSSIPTRRPSVRLQLEELERRLAPAVVPFNVTTYNDNGDNTTPLANSLRAAINAVNAGKANEITFNIKDDPLKGRQRVVVNKVQLPTITSEVTIDGTTSPTGSVEITVGTTPPPALKGPNGLVLGTGASGSQLLGLTIDGFKQGFEGGMVGDGILLNNVANVHIGWMVDPKNQENQIYAPVMTYSNATGIEINGMEATGNSVLGSYVGTNDNSAPGLGNVSYGILIDNNANLNTIGGWARNVISSTQKGVGKDIGAGIGVMIRDANNNTLDGNDIGTDSTGKKPLPNLAVGVMISGQSAGNHIGVKLKPWGGVAPDPANLISGNGVSGVLISGQKATGNTIEGNWIGVDSTGNKALPNPGSGVSLSDTTENTIGGATLDSFNVISGNGIGVFISSNSTSNKVQNNNIGIGPDWDPETLVAVPNSSDGISYDNTAQDNINKGNLILFNGGKAVDDPAEKNKTVDPNEMFDNGFGIYTGTEAGAPVLSSAVVSGNSVTITGTLSSTPNAQFTLEFFGNTVQDPSGYGEGEFYLGTLLVNTDANGNASFSATFNAVAGSYASATATNNAADGSTSQFSNDVAITGESQTAAVGGNVWNDANADGLPDNGETGVSNVAVQLYTSGGSLVASTTSDTNGNYFFTGVSPGDYYLKFTSPSGYFFTTPYQGDATVASHADPSDGTTEGFTLTAGEVLPFVNAGLIPTTLQEATSTTIDSSENPSLYGDEVTFIATVTPTDVVPLGGTVSFEDGNTVLDTENVASSDGSYQATFTTTSLALGNHTITAVYNGDGFHVGSSASLTQTVQQQVSVTDVTSSNTPALVGQPVTFTASVVSVGGTPTGTMTFDDGSNQLGTATLDANGNATFTTSTLAQGSHAITASYGGDTNFLGSSGSMTQVISQETSSTLSLSSSANPGQAGQAVTFTAMVRGNGGTPTGDVTFLDGTTVLDTATLDANGNATFSTTDLLLGSQSITAIYGGDGTFGSSSASLVETVNQVSSSTFLARIAHRA